MDRHTRSVGAVVFVLAGASAVAHPTVMNSTPRNGESLASAPRAMHIAFTEPVEAAFTTFRLVDANSRELGGGQARSDPADPKAIFVDLPVLATGVYTAHWSALGRDGHRARGHLTFSVK
jgi:methionine-rich copper-binding protein CopC